MAQVMGAEAALVRIQFVSGTHAISTALSTVLRPGDELLAVVGKYVVVRGEGCIGDVCGGRVVLVNVGVTNSLWGSAVGCCYCCC